MNIGITLPQFRPESAAALDAAIVAERSGLDGVFVYDHVWAIGRPDRLALNAWPLLGALSVATQRVTLGTLVARVSLLPNAVLAHNFESLQRMLGDRLVAGMGAGDRLSEPENVGVDVPFPPASVRLSALADACRRTRAMGITTWVGGLSPAVRAIARGDADALNLWAVAPDRVADTAAAESADRRPDGTSLDVTWGGAAPATAGETADLLRRLDAAGATWAVCAPPYGAARDPTSAVEMVAEAAAVLR